VKTEKAQFVLDAGDESAYNRSEASTVVLGTDLPSVGGAFSMFGGWPGGLIIAPATIDIGGTVFVYAEPTWQFLTIYPELEPEPAVDILEDLDIPFKSLKTRTVKGIVVEREKAKFTTAFIDELVDDRDIA